MILEIGVGAKGLKYPAVQYKKEFLNVTQVCINLEIGKFDDIDAIQVPGSAKEIISDIQYLRYNTDER